MTSKHPPKFSITIPVAWPPKIVEPRRKTAIGLSQLADLYARLGGQAMGEAIRKVTQQICVEKDPELQSLLSAAFVRLSQEASEAKNYQAVNEVCAGMETLLQQRPVMVNDLRPRVGVENRIPEFIEEALRAIQSPAICCWCCAAPPSRGRNILPIASSAACDEMSATAWSNWSKNWAARLLPSCGKFCAPGNRAKPPQ